MTAKGFASAAIEDVLEQLTRERLQDDGRFAESYIRQRLARGFGPVKIRVELADRGIDKALCKLLFEQLDIDWCEHAAAVWRKKFPDGYRDYRARAKQARFLQSRGFTSDQISELLMKGTPETI